ncbi:hypothetical protein JXB22_05560 [candidate division WOR-3 bacterium]|nr:hypothetical protein [candidate division WOR-3 bacterium]
MKRVNITILFLLISLFLNGLTLNDVYHSPNNIFYVNPSIHEVKVRLKQSSPTQIHVYVDTIPIAMSSVFREDSYEYYAATVPGINVGASYYFTVTTDQGTLRIPQIGEFTATVPAFTTPSWAHGKIYYSIIPDGFSNGDPTNDPEDKRSWGSEPHQWQPYGGDLVGIRNKIAYIESLGVDIILLEPIFIAESNHKFNPRDYALIDPHLGDTIALKNLINEIHRRSMKIVCTMPFSHTGMEFPTFEDIEKNQAESKYLDWYRITALPIRKSPPTYECWLDDPEFPKLNLSNAQVANYLLGYLEYWKHFGFDGFFIGEDSILDPTFIQTLRTNLKLRYPDILLTGSDRRLVSGSGLDGCYNRKLTDLLTAYFINRSIPTSEFDRGVRKILFFNPQQVNNINLIRVSDYTTRRFCPNPALQANLYVFMLTMPGSPTILFGDEVGMTRSIWLNCGSFPWNESDQNRTLLETIRRLIKIRKEHPEFSSTAFYSLYADDIHQVYAYDRGGIIVIINSSDKETFIELPAWSGVYGDVITGEKKTAYNQRLRLTIGPQTYQILKREF